MQPSGFRVFFLKVTNYNANECYCIQPWKVLKILSAVDKTIKEALLANAARSDRRVSH